MTIQRLNGFWDENGEALVSLANTIARSVNPHFDNQLALAKMLREDPTKQQAILDMDSLNPGILDQMYGTKAAENIRSRGTPSVAARTERAGRDIADMNPNEVPNTVIAGAALRGMTGKDAADRRQQEAEIVGREQQTENYAWEYDQKKWLANLENPVIKARYQAIQEAIAANPDYRLFDPYAEAKNLLQGTMDPQRLATLEALPPEYYEMFKIAVQDMGQNARADRAENRADARIRAQVERDDRTDRNAARRQARVVSERTGLSFKDLEAYYMGEENVNPAVLKFFQEEQTVQERFRLLDAQKKLQGFIDDYQKSEGQGRTIAKNALEAGLRNVFNAPITIKTVPDKETWTPWDDKAIYLLPDGREVNGEILYNLANEPEAFVMLNRNGQLAREYTPADARAAAAELRQKKEAFIASSSQFIYEQFLSDLEKRAGGSTRERRPR